MAKKEIIPPQDGLIKDLEKIANGSLLWYLKPSDLAGLQDEEAEEWLVLEICEVHLEEVRALRWNKLGFLDMEEPFKMEDGRWCCGVFISPLGEECLAHWRRGVDWNATERRPDWDSTIARYRKYLAADRLPSAELNRLAENRDPQLSGLRSELIAWRLAAGFIGLTNDLGVQSAS
jgi:hypothetical protein